MVKKLFLLFGLTTLGFGAEKTYRVAQTEQVQYAEIDAYIAQFNKLIQLMQTHENQPALVLKAEVLSTLSDSEKKWFLVQMVNSASSDLKLVRSGAQVSVVHNPTTLTVAKIDVSNFANTGQVAINGRSVDLRAIFLESGLKKRSALIAAEVARIREEKKTVARKVVETIFQVVTLPLSLLTACAEGQFPPAGSAAAAAAANGHTFTQGWNKPIFQAMGSSPKDGSALQPATKCYHCTDGVTYDNHGRAPQKPLFNF